MAFRLTSPAFSPGGHIPEKYTRDGADISPPLDWSEPPPGTRSFALLLEDPDAPKGTFRHWAMYNIPAHQRSLSEGMTVPHEHDLTATAANDFGHARYDGPRPPKGDRPHHYRFRLAALDVEALPEQVEPDADVWRAVQGHILAEADLVGTYRH